MRLKSDQVADGPEPARSLYTFDEQDGKTTVTLKIDYTLPGKWLGQVEAAVDEPA
ncbi:MAG: hypothetical protein ACK2UK_19705 [Candidatus Promineifilaceae bacterium]